MHHLAVAVHVVERVRVDHVPPRSAAHLVHIAADDVDAVVARPAPQPPPGGAPRTPPPAAAPRVVDRARVPPVPPRSAAHLVHIAADDVDAVVARPAGDDVGPEVAEEAVVARAAGDVVGAAV